MGYVFAAYAVFWGLTFILVVAMASKQKRLEKEIEALRRAVEKERQ
jgi:CcmD family protein